MKIIDYITGSRKGKEAHRIEEEAMKDPFLADAIEGYDLVKDEGHARRIAELQRKVYRKSHRRIHIAQITGIAAGLLLCVGLGGYFVQNRDFHLFDASSPIAYSSEAPMMDELEDAPTSHMLAVPEPLPLPDPSIKGEPQPATGKKRYEEYVENNLFIPAFDECAHTKGKVVVAFKVNTKGRPYDLDVKKSLCPTADLEAIRVVKEGPNWTLGDKVVNLTIRF